MRCVRCWPRVAALPGCVLWLTSCIQSADSLPSPIPVAAGLRAEYVVVSETPVAALACVADGRVFYTEQETGQIRAIKDGQLLERPFATVPVNFAGDRGLLGIALHPRFEDNGRLYVFYSRSDTGQSTDDPQAIIDHRIVYFEADGDVAATGEVPVAYLPVGLGVERVGGRLAFGPDRTLHVGFGDTTDTGAAQAQDQLFGKILRYNDDGSIPADNPTADSAVYARGLCDPRGLTFDPTSGVLFAVDRSGAGPDEINRILAGKNYGWPAVAGLADQPAEQDFVAQNADYADPLAESDRALAGAAFNPSSKYGPDAVLAFFYAIAGGGRVERLALSPERSEAGEIFAFASRLPTLLTDVAFTPAGTLYLASERAVLRITPVAEARLAPE